MLPPWSNSTTPTPYQEAKAAQYKAPVLATALPMIHKNQFFDDFIAALLNGATPEMPTVGRSYCVAGHSLHLENNLCDDAAAQRLMASFERPGLRFLHPRSPYRRVRGPLVMLPVLLHSRVIDLFCCELFGGMVVLAIYGNRPQLAYELASHIATSA